MEEWGNGGIEEGWKEVKRKEGRKERMEERMNGGNRGMKEDLGGVGENKLGWREGEIDGERKSENVWK